ARSAGRGRAGAVAGRRHLRRADGGAVAGPLPVLGAPGSEEVAEGPEAGPVVRLRQMRLGVAARLELGGLLLGLRALHHRQPDPPRRWVELDDGHLHLVVDGDHLARVRDASVEHHAGDVDEPVQARRQLDEGAELLEPPHAAAHVRPDREAIARGIPRIRSERAYRQADATAALRIGLELHHLHLDLLTDAQHVGSVRHAGVADLAHVNQTLDAAEIDERSEVTDRRHRAGEDGPLAQPLPRLRGLRGGFLLEELPAGDDDVPSSSLELRDAEAQAFADVGPAVRAAPVDLGARAEGSYA